MNEENHESTSELEQAISARLSRLRALPVDTSRLDKCLRAKLPEPRPQWRVLRLRSVRAIAASFVLFSGIVGAILLTASSGRALASSAQMAQMHEDIVAGR